MYKLTLNGVNTIVQSDNRNDIETLAKLYSDLGATLVAMKATVGPWHEITLQSWPAPILEQVEPATQVG